jgi:hypothetical protein
LPVAFMPVKLARRGPVALGAEAMLACADGRWHCARQAIVEDMTGWRCD